MILPLVFQWILGIAAVLTALGVVWIGGRKLFRIDAALPTLLQIADQFKPNDGASLLDRVENIERVMILLQHDLEPILIERRTRG